MYITVLPVCVSMHHLCAWCPWRLEEGVRFLEQALQMVVSVHVGADPLEEQLVLLITRASLQHCIDKYK